MWLKQLQIKHAVFEHKLVLLSLSLIKKKARQDASPAITQRESLSFEALSFAMPILRYIISYDTHMVSKGAKQWPMTFDIAENLVCECKCDGDSLSTQLPKDCGTVAGPTA